MLIHSKFSFHSFIEAHCIVLFQWVCLHCLYFFFRFRWSYGDLGGGSHCIGHNAVVACLRLDHPGTALQLLMDKVHLHVQAMVQYLGLNLLIRQLALLGIRAVSILEPPQLVLAG